MYRSMIVFAGVSSLVFPLTSHVIVVQSRDSRYCSNRSVHHCLTTQCRPHHCPNQQKQEALASFGKSHPDANDAGKSLH